MARGQNFYLIHLIYKNAAQSLFPLYETRIIATLYILQYSKLKYFAHELTVERLPAVLEDEPNLTHSPD